ncbi:MAG: cytochrome c biogenesis protein CcsA [Phycisphaerales bacterium]
MARIKSLLAALTVLVVCPCRPAPASETPPPPPAAAPGAPVPALKAESSAPTRAALERLGTVAIQDGGRVMPLEGYARRLAAKVTGREKWGAGRGPAAYSGRTPMELLADAMFRGQALLHEPLVGIENRPFKEKVGLDPQRKFFSPVEIAACQGINAVLGEFATARQHDPQASPNKDQRMALDIRDAVERVAALASGEPLAIVPAGPDRPFLRAAAGAGRGDPGAASVSSAVAALGQAYTSGADINGAVDGVIAAVSASGEMEPRDARAVRLELFYDRHQPWRQTSLLYGLSIVLFGLSRLMLRRALVALAIVAALAGVAEHLLGIGLRVAILGRAPVSNTYEALLWMGLVGIGIGGVAQLMNRQAWYLFGGVAAAFVCGLFAGMMPLEDQTNSLPAVLRSNFWLIIHVLTIVASYGVLAVASVLGHVYLAKEVLLARRGGVFTAEAPKRSAPLIVQTYRTIQVGLFLLTAGTILGGVWAAESWGRFWGWDPKETWALISILVYLAVLHARHIRWLMDFGLAAAAVLGFVVIVWTFYGVNYVMASGLHSYGFGSGGEVWVGLWAAAELAFLSACRVRYVALKRRPRGGAVSPRGAAAV